MNSRRVLVAVPAYNEEATIESVVTRVRSALPECDLLVVDDGSEDGTTAILERLGVATARHLTNLGYGRAIQTALLAAARNGYDALVTVDADGQHHPDQIRPLLEAFFANGWDVCVGSRHVAACSYRGVPLGRRLGMLTFSLLVRIMGGRRVWDTTSGLRAIARPAFAPLACWHFVDFHADAIIYLMRLGFSIGEFPITVDERRHGESMYSLLGALKYPLKTLLTALLGLSHAALIRRGGSR